MARRRTWSSVLKKVPISLRHRIDAAIRERPPGLVTYREVWEHFGLAGLGVPFTTFARYGRLISAGRLGGVQTGVERGAS